MRVLGSIRETKFVFPNNAQPRAAYFPYDNYIILILYSTQNRRYTMIK